jgi:Calcium-dependent channel, 7TM region, putative phosphate
MLAMLLGLIYCTISPLMCPIVLCYFAVAWILSKYQAIYVLRSEYESGGQVRAARQTDRQTEGPCAEDGATILAAGVGVDLIWTGPIAMGAWY